jgi:hypothetical protein
MSNLGYPWSCSGGSSSDGLPGSRESSNLRTVASNPQDAPDATVHPADALRTTSGTLGCLIGPPE